MMLLLINCEIVIQKKSLTRLIARRVWGRNTHGSFKMTPPPYIDEWVTARASYIYIYICVSFMHLAWKAIHFGSENVRALRGSLGRLFHSHLFL